jgi:DMSO/TMAO reductase YedYZ heme-binding membrane subunit
LRSAPAPVKARITFQSDNGPAPMIAIGIIALFLVVILALNKFEFGRFD